MYISNIKKNIFNQHINISIDYYPFALYRKIFYSLLIFVLKLWRSIIFASMHMNYRSTYAGTALLRRVGKLSFRSLWTPNWRCSHVTKSGIQFCRFWCVEHENGRYPISLLQRSYRLVSREGTLLENNITLRFVTARNVLKIFDGYTKAKYLVCDSNL